MKYRAIIVDLEGLKALERECVEQRGGTYTARHDKLIEEGFKYICPSGKKRLIDGDLGGGIGSDKPSTWTRWSVEQMADILTAHGIKFEWGYEECTFIKLW